MSNGFGRYHFIAWARQGVAASIANPDYGGSLQARAGMQLGLTVNARGTSGFRVGPKVDDAEHAELERFVAEVNARLGISA